MKTSGQVWEKVFPTWIPKAKTQKTQDSPQYNNRELNRYIDIGPYVDRPHACWKACCHAACPQDIYNWIKFQCSLYYWKLRGGFLLLTSILITLYKIFLFSFLFLYSFIYLFLISNDEIYRKEKRVKRLPRKMLFRGRHLLITIDFSLLHSPKNEPKSPKRRK